MFALPSPSAPVAFPKMRTPHSTWARMLAMTPLLFKKIVVVRSRLWVPPSASTTLLVPNQVHGDHIVAVTSNGADDLEDVREQIARGL